MPNLLDHYKKLIRAKKYQHDERQEPTLLVLQQLLNELKRPKFLSFFHRNDVEGVYIYGGVGRGKSMLMDLFFEAVPDKIKKRRIHFHEFMIETHDWLHHNRGVGMDDLLMRYADYVGDQISLLCFDEFHVSDITDAMILGRLFEAFFKKNITIIATSNCAPDNLYEGGLQRDLFLPFIETLKEKMTVIELDGGRDYRALSSPDQDMYYFYPRDDETQKKIDQLFAELTHNANPTVQTLAVKGRKLSVLTVGDIARFSFNELFQKPLGAEDYITIAQQFDTIFVENIPFVTPDMRNEAKRFILFIDCVYEAKCRLILSAETDIHCLYDGQDHAFEFDRTISRLMEMQSSDYHAERMKASS